MDPWLIDGEYYGSWYHFPKLELNLDLINSCNYIYISHIHPDHFSKASFGLLKKEIPVLIHDYESKFLKFNIEKLGFTVIELPNNKAFTLSGTTYIKIVAADNCNPELCGRFFGCSFVENKDQSTQNDSMALVYDDHSSVLNINDCPFELGEGALEAILEQHPRIDLLLVGYAGAGPYPQCFILPEEEKIKAAENKKLQFLEQGVKYINKVNPVCFMPFAGTYTLGGKLRELNQYRGVPELDFALDYLNKNIGTSSKGFLLNQYAWYDLVKKEFSSEYRSFSPAEKEIYIEKVLSGKKMDFEDDAYPSEHEVFDLIPAAFKRFSAKKLLLNFNSDTKMIFRLSETKDIVIDLSADCKYSIEEDLQLSSLQKYVRISLDSRLLLRILKGPKFAHWNNAEIGSHLTFERKPNVYESAFYYVFCFFHV